MTDKAREMRARRLAARMGYRLVKSCRRDPRAYDYGVWWVVQPDPVGDRPALCVSSESGASLAGAELWLAQTRRQAALRLLALWAARDGD